MPPKRKETESDQGKQAMPIAAVETVIDTHAALIGEVDRLSQSWIKRRMEAVEQTRRIVNEMKAGGDPTAIFTAHQNWFSGALTRMMSDFGDLNTFALNCINRTGDSLLAATRSGQEAVHEGLARAGAKPGMGVREVRDSEGPTPPPETTD